MSKPRAIWAAGGFVLLIAALGGAALQMDIPLNAIDGVEQGMSQRDALQKMAEAGVGSVVPVVSQPVVVRGADLDDLPELMQSEGICISDNAGVAMNLQLEKGGAVTTLYASAAAETQLGIVRSRQEAEELLRSALPKVRGLVAGRCVPGARWVSLPGNEADSVYLLGQSAWRYRRLGSYSWVTVQFAEGKVSRIEYRWQPFEA